jgi:hypothetical protein
MSIIEKYMHNVPWLESKMSFIRNGARLVENGICLNFGTPIFHATIEEHIKYKNTGHLKIRSIPSGNVIWCVYDEEMNEVGEYRSEEEARKVMPENGDILEIDLDEMFEIVDEYGKNITGMLYPTENRAWVFLYGILNPEVWSGYIAACILLELFDMVEDKKKAKTEEKTEEIK